MSPKFVLIVCLLLLSACSTTPPAAKTAFRVGGYYASNNVYKRDYQVADIPAAKLTHIYYSFLKIDSDFTLTYYDKNAEIVKKVGSEPTALGYRGSFAQFQILKQKDPKLRVLASVGGGNLSANFSPMAATAKTRQTFIDSSVAFLVKYGFDGIDLDWEFPVDGGQAGVAHSPQDGRNLTLLVQGLRKAFDAQGAKDGKHYEVGLTVTPNPGYAKYLEVGALGKLVDFVNVMTYDYHGAWDAVTNHLAPLYANPSDPGYRWAATRKLNVAGAVQYYLDQGLPPGKLNLGIPLYGVGWQIAPKAKAPLYAAAVDKPTLKQTGTLDYADVQKLVAQGLHAEWDAAAHAPYLYNAETGLFVSYDDGRSVTEKVELVVEKRLGGVFFWELSQDRGGELVNFTTWTLGRTAAN